MLRPGAPSTPGRASAFAGKFGEAPALALAWIPTLVGAMTKNQIPGPSSRAVASSTQGTLMPSKFGVMSLMAPGRWEARVPRLRAEASLGALSTALTYS